MLSQCLTWPDGSELWVVIFGNYKKGDFTATSYKFAAKDASFSDFLQRTQHVTMTNADLDMLSRLCNGSDTCKFLPAPIVLPPGLQCGAGDVCVTCGRIDNVYNAFKTDYPGIAPSITDVNEPQRSYNRLFEKYMNSRLGFGKRAADYLQFMADCKASQSGASCQDLQNLLISYSAQRPDGITHHAYLGSDMNDFTDIVSNGILRPQASVRNATEFPFYSNYTIHPRDGVGHCFDSSFAVEYRFKFPQLTGTNASSDLYMSASLHVSGIFQLLGTGANRSFYLAGVEMDHATDTCTNRGYYKRADQTSPCMQFEGTNQIVLLAAAGGGVMDDWMTIRIKTLRNKYQFYCNGHLVYEQDRQPAPLYWNYSEIAFNYAKDWQIDYIKIYGDNDQVIYNEDYNSVQQHAVLTGNFCTPFDCEGTFVSYYNQQKGTNYSFAQIDAIYLATCGQHLTVCNVPGANGGGGSNVTAVGNGPLLCGRNESMVKTIDNYHEDTPCDDLLQFSTNRGMEQYNVYRQNLIGDFTNSYIAECLKAAELESFTVQQTVSEYHYTLYYYDQAGNLLKTVPPEGVQYDFGGSWQTQIQQARAAHADLPRQHRLLTQYRYNTLNQVTAQQSPDGGTSLFWYDRLGRLAVSQNAKQLEDGNNYSYTKYDYLGRITEVGQVKAPATGMTDNISRNPESLQQWLTDNGSKREQVTRTQYDVPGKDLSPYVSIRPRNLRSRVAYTSFTSGNDPLLYNSATYYDYDIHGNVSTLLQDYGDNSEMAAKGQQFKRMDYQYDLISGKVNQVVYQPGYRDQFFHRYSYDAENRITCVATSTNGVLWEKEARYQYYRHGPLARMELGQQQVQGLDYAYTLQGWLKCVNGTTLHPGGGVGDMGGDGGVNSARNALDVYGYSLHYYEGDYNAIGQPQWLTGLGSPLQQQNSYRPLYNGNISSMAVNLPVVQGARGAAPVLYNYSYDQLNRLTGMDAFNGSNSGTQLWDNGLSSTAQWKERISYDGNGNIKDYTRNGDNRSVAMDKLHYQYKTNSNQLLRVTDEVVSGTPSDYHDVQSQPENNYAYDGIGNLVRDTRENITGISWSAYGKILQVTKTVNSQTQTIGYSYDAAGNRISKQVNGATTYYVRDAGGNTMAVYTMGDNTVNNGAVTLQEQHLYGSSRLGIQKPGLEVSSLLPAYSTQVGTTTKSIYSIFERGKKFFELSNHLGNVLATVSDKKYLLAANSTGNGGCAPGSAAEDVLVSLRGTETVYTGRSSVSLLPGFESSGGDNFEVYTDAGLSACNPATDNSTATSTVYAAEVVCAQDYAPFGMELVGRQYNASSYRYGFNGKENDNEVKGEGNQQDYGMRVYDPRLGRFLSEDPITAKYPELTPYQFASNSPIDGVDEDGLEWAPTKDKEGNTTNYNWAGYNSDGTAKKGTVASAVLNKGDYNYLFTSNQKNQTGTLDIMTTKHAPTSYPQGNDNSTQYNYTFKFQQYGINPIYQYTNVTASLWNVSEKLSLFSGANSQVNNYVSNKSVVQGFPTWADKSISTNNLFSDFRLSLGLRAPATALVPDYPETILLPLPKGLKFLGAEFKAETGGLNQWLRMGESYSKAGGFKTYGLRWGAGGNFWKKIGNTTLQNLNKEFRQTKLPFGGWRSADAGHFHFWRK